MLFMVALSGHRIDFLSVPRPKLRLTAFLSGSQHPCVCSVRRRTGTMSRIPIYFELRASLKMGYEDECSLPADEDLTTHHVFK
jgi:hypothetical protein